MTRELCLYQRGESLFKQVTDCMNNYIAIRINKLSDSLSMENADVLTIMDSFWTSLYNVVKTISFLLAHLSQSDKRYTSPLSQHVVKTC